MEIQWAVLARNIVFAFNVYLYLKMREGNRELQVICLVSDLKILLSG